MSLETAADPRIRPSIGPQATPYYAAAQASALDRPESRVQRASLEVGPALEVPGQAEGFEFADLLDIINPLQHLPLISTLYRDMTGDEIKAPARILGGFLYGGPLGFVGSIADVVAEEVSGRDLTETVLAFVIGDDVEALAPAEDLAEKPADPSPEPADPSPGPAVGAALVPAAGPVAPAFVTNPAAAQPPQSAASSALVEESKAAPAKVLEPMQALTGQAALDAFVGDLRTIGLARDGGAPNGETPKTDTAGEQPAQQPQVSGVPANLAGLGSRDKRGLATKFRIDPTASIETRTATANLKAPGQKPGKGLFDPNIAGAALIDPNLLAQQGPLAPGGTADVIPAGEQAVLSRRMLEALEKYEYMLKQRQPGSTGTLP